MWFSNVKINTHYAEQKEFPSTMELWQYIINFLILYVYWLTWYHTTDTHTHIHMHKDSTQIHTCIHTVYLKLNKSLFSSNSSSYVQWDRPLIPATWEDDAKDYQIQGQSRLQSESKASPGCRVSPTPAQAIEWVKSQSRLQRESKASLDDLMGFCLKQIKVKRRLE